MSMFLNQFNVEMIHCVIINFIIALMYLDHFVQNYPVADYTPWLPPLVNRAAQDYDTARQGKHVIK